RPLLARAKASCRSTRRVTVANWRRSGLHHWHSPGRRHGGGIGRTGGWRLGCGRRTRCNVRGSVAWTRQWRRYNCGHWIGNNVNGGFAWRRCPIVCDLWIHEIRTQSSAATSTAYAIGIRLGALGYTAEGLIYRHSVRSLIVEIGVEVANLAKSHTKVERSSKREKISAPLTNPYLIARREWDERYGNLITRAKNWRLMAILCCLIALIQTAGMIVLSLRSKVVPYVVAVDSLGRPVA